LPSAGAIWTLSFSGKICAPYDVFLACGQGYMEDQGQDREECCLRGYTSTSW
jgi:hypothetical protein